MISDERNRHIKRHEELHRMLDELVADFVRHTKGSLRKTSVMDFMAWAHEQTIDPTEEGEEE